MERVSSASGSFSYDLKISLNDDAVTKHFGFRWFEIKRRKRRKFNSLPETANEI